MAHVCAMRLRAMRICAWRAAQSGRGRGSGRRRSVDRAKHCVSYAYGPEPHAEGDALASADGNEPSAVTARGVRALEEAVLNAPSIDGIVLRYGRLYGPGTWNAECPEQIVEAERR